MKGSAILLGSIIAAAICCKTASAQEIQVSDTVATATVSAVKAPIAFTGLRRLDSEDLLEGTAVLGTPDVIKVLQNMPGVSHGVELLSGLYVHGGDGSDNLFLLDNVPLFQISHLAGLFSSFNTDIIRSVDFYKSGFPARFGGRLSSVVDVNTSDGSMEKFGGSVSIGLIDGRIRLNGPIIKNRLSYDIAVRRSWLDAIIAPALAIQNSGSKSKTKGGYALFDSNVNITYAPSWKDKVNLRFFAGTDNFNYSVSEKEKFYGDDIYYLDSGQKIGIKWGNIAASADWNHLFSKDSRIRTTAYYSGGYSDISNYNKSNEIFFDTATPQTYDERSVGDIRSAGIKSLYSISLNHHNLSAGIEYQHLGYAPARFTEKTYDGECIFSSDVRQKYRSDEASVFVEDEMIYGPFSFTAGVRLESFFTEEASYVTPLPRVSASYNITKDLIVKASYESMRQYSHLLSSVFLDLPTNLWMPSTDKIRPSDSRQVALGLFGRISKNWHFDVSGYYRTIDNCIIYSGTSSIFPPIDKWEEDFTSGKGRSYGAEVELKYITDRFRGSAFYTLSWNERKFEELYPEWFKDRFDNRHKFTLVCSYQITRDIDINATWSYHSGNRVTMPEHISNSPEGGSILLFSKPYNAKMPDYHRLDLSCNFRRKTRRGNESCWNISIYNAYCRMNPILMTFMREEGSDRPVAKIYSIVPILPSFSYTYKF